MNKKKKEEKELNQKKIISIEDRIPKLKQERKKKANRRLIFYLSIFFLLIAIVIYLQSPLSSVHEVQIVGNKYVEENVIKSLSGVTTDDNYWRVNNKEIVESVSDHPEIKVVEVSKKWPATIRIIVEEFQRVGYVKRDGKYFPLLENGERLASFPLNSVKGDAPLLTGFTKQIYLEEMTRELQRLPSPVVDLISEIFWEPTEGNPYKIGLFMNDGYEVEGSIRNFSKAMKTYPSIAAQLDPGTRGVIHMGDGGAIFNPYTNDQQLEEENTDEVER